MEVIEESVTVKVGIEIPASLHQRLKIEAAQRNLKMKDVYREALESWLTPPQPERDAEFHRQMAIARKIMVDYREALKELAR